MAEVKYTKTHEWVRFSNETTAEVGLTEYATKQMGALVFLELPSEGDRVEAGESLGDAESIKAVSEIISPVTGEVSKVNEALLDDPGLVNAAPMEHWLVEVSDIEGTEELLDEAAYQAFCETL